VRFPQFSEAGRKRLVVGAIATGATVVVLAGIMFISSALSSPRGSSTTPVIQATQDTTAEQTAEEAYQAALDAYRSGDTTQAAAILQQQLATNPNDARARTLLEEITAAKPTTPSSNSGGSGSSANAASLSADPAEKALQDRVSHALFAVHDLKSTAAANKYLTKVSKPVYPKNAAKVDVGGYPGYFGTDGTTKATIVYVRGRYVFETIITTVSQPPGSLKDVATAIAPAYRD